MGEKTPGMRLADVIRRIHEDEGGSYRKLERLMVERTGDRVTATYMTNAVQGSIINPREVEIRKLAAAFPKFARELWAIVGMDPQEPALPADVAAHLDREAKRRGLSHEDMLRKAVENLLMDPRSTTAIRGARCGQGA